MKKILFFVVLLSLVIATPAFAWPTDPNIDYSVTAKTWNFEESAGESLTSYAKASAGIVYGWKTVALDQTGVQYYALLYDGNYSSGNVKLRDELYVNSTDLTNDTFWPFGAVFETEISVTRSSITGINVYVYFR